MYDLDHAFRNRAFRNRAFLETAPSETAPSETAPNNTVSTVTPTPADVDIPQYSVSKVLGIWAAAALPMAALAWIVAPAIAGPDRALAPVLFACLTAGLVSGSSCSVLIL